MTRIIPRAEWGARYADGFASAPVPADGLWLHHSVTIAPDLVAPFDDDFAAVRTLERIGQSRFKGGISYTFASTPVGLLFQGHSVNRRGAHTGGHNTRTRAVVLVGDYSNNPPTAAQINSIGWLLKEGLDKGWWKRATLLGGHRDASGASTACPGNAGHSSIGRINAAAAGTPTQPTHVVPPVKPAPRAADTIPYDFPYPRGHYLGTARRDPACHSGYYRADRKHIAAWQEGMRRRGWNITVDGGFGPASQAVAAKFQKEKGLAVDGLVGAATWAATDRSPIT